MVVIIIFRISETDDGDFSALQTHLLPFLQQWMEVVLDDSVLVGRSCQYAEISLLDIFGFAPFRALQSRLVFSGVQNLSHLLADYLCIAATAAVNDGDIGHKYSEEQEARSEKREENFTLHSLLFTSVFILPCSPSIFKRRNSYGVIRKVKTLPMRFYNHQLFVMFFSSTGGFLGGGGGGGLGPM